MKTTFKKVALASALLASSAIISPAMATGADYSASTAATGIDINLAAPVTSSGALTFAPGTKVRFTIERGTGLTDNDVDSMRLVAFRWNGTPSVANYLTADSAEAYAAGSVVGPIAGATSSLTTFDLTLPTGTYTNVAFALVFAGDQTALTNPSDDTIDGANANRRMIILNPTSRNPLVGVDYTVQLVPQYTTTGGANANAASITTAEINAIHANAAAQAALFAAAKPVTTGYAGPKLTTVGVADTTATNNPSVRLTFNTALANTGNALDAPANLSPLLTATPAGAFTGNRQVVTTVNPGEFAVVVNNAGVPLAAALTSMTTTTGAAIQDEAGNQLETNITVSATRNPAPNFATITASQRNTFVTGATGSASMRKLWSANGYVPTAGDKIDISVAMASALSGGSLDATNDVVIAKSATPTDSFATAALTFDTVQTANSAIPVVRFALNPARTYRFNPTSGALETKVTATEATWTPVYFAFGVGTTPITDGVGSVIATDSAVTTARPVVAGAAPDLDIVSIETGTPDGLVDGARLDFGAPLAVGNVVSKIDAVAPAALATSLTPTKALTSDNTGVNVTFANPSTTFAAADYPSKFNTGATTALPFRVSLAATDATYQYIWNPATTNLLPVSSTITAAAGTALANGAVQTDGAAPVLLSATFDTAEANPAKGTLRLNFSENVGAGNTAYGIDTGNVKIANAPLSVLNLNSNLSTMATATAARTFNTVSLTDGQLTITEVPASVVTGAVTLGTAGASIKDAAGATANTAVIGAPVTVAAGTTTLSTPAIVQAAAARDNNDPSGNITSIIVRYDQDVKLANGGAFVDGLFKVRVGTGAAGGTTIDVPANNGVQLQNDKRTIVLNLPTPGIPGRVTDLVVEYDAGAGLNKLVRVQDETVAASDTGSAGPALAANADGIFTGHATNDGDTSRVTFPANSTKLYTMEVKGTLTADGSAVTPKGTIVRADLVDFDQSLSIKSINVTVPCQCTNGANLAIGNGSYAALATLLEDNARVGKVTKAYITTTIESSGAVKGVSLSTTQPGAPADRTYEVTVSQPANGQITISGNGVTGAGVVEQAPALKVLDTVYQVTNDGKFRFAIGNDTAPKNAFVSIAVKRPDDRFFSAITSPVQSFDNHLPFASNVTASGVIGGNLGTVNLSQIKSTSVDSSAGWQLVGLQGEIARTSDSVRKNTPVTLERLLISVRGTNGEPVSAWSHDHSVADEGFLLVNNVTNSALQIDTTTVDNIRQVNGGLAIALKNSDGKFAIKDVNAVIGDVGADLNAIGAADPFNVYYRSTTDSTALNAQAAKWSLLTMEASVADIATWANTNKVGAIIVVGSNNQQKAWFKGATDNTLSSLARGDRAFVFFEGANTAFKFGR